MIATIAHLLLIVAAVTLPLGTRYILVPGNLNNGPWEYGTVSVYASEVFIWLAALFTLATVRKRDWKKALLMLAAAAFMFLFQKNLGWCIHAISAILLVVALRRNREHLVSVSAAFLAGVSVQVLLGFVQVIIQRVSSSTILGMAGHLPAEAGASVVGTAAGRFLRAYGTLPHPNVLGAYAVVGLALSLWLLRYKVSSRMHGALVGSTALFGIGAAISFSRAAWIAMALVLLVAWLTARRRSMHEKVSVMGSTLIAIAGLTMCFIFWRTAVIPRLFLKTDFSIPGQQELETRSITERTGSMREALRVIEKHPFMGVGGGNYTRAVRDELDPSRELWGYQPAHNTVLLILAELGIIGFIALAVLLTLSKPQFGLGLVALLPFMVTDHFLWSLWPGLALAGFAFGIARPASFEALDKASVLS